MTEPRLRASDTDRNQVLAVLSQAMSNGQLSFAEFDERTQEVTKATYRDELIQPLKDLVPLPERILSNEVALRPEQASLQAVDRAQTGDQFSLSIMGGSEKKGAWTIARTHTSLAIMGGNDLDLTKATFAHQDITISAWAIMGGITIYVPEDVRVKCDGVAIMGGFGVIEDEDVTIDLATLPENAPLVRVTGLALMGGVDVKRVRRA